jgi:RimJ/RimL family protein N-acetyltransferase
MYIIETARLGLRNWQEEDVPLFAKMNADPRVMEFFPSLLTATETAEMIQRIQTHIKTNGFGFWAVELKDSNEFIGFTGLAIPRFQAAFTPCVEIGWRLAAEYWNKGYAQEAANACFDYGFDQLQLPEIVAFTTVANKRSIYVMERTGMKYQMEFDHPSVDEAGGLRRHVLYVKRNEV